MTTARTLLDRSMSERQFQKAVIEMAQRLGWRVAWFPDEGYRELVKAGRFDALPDAGYPDLTLVRIGGGRARLIFAELKSARGRLRPEQEAWCEALVAVEGAAPWTVSYRVWKPHQMDEIEETLRS
jgi:hypothetical protein